MYQTNKENEYCLICGDNIDKHVSIHSLLFKQKKVCISCLNKFDDICLKDEMIGYEVLYLYHYNEFFKNILYQYKGLYDIALKDVFLLKHQTYLQKKYKGYIIAIAPSSKIENETRGFAPMEEIVKALRLPIFVGLYKNKYYKQASKSFHERNQIVNIISIKDTQMLNNKKVLLVDDVMTSGNTIKACIHQLETTNCIDIKVLIIAKNIRKEHKI